MPDDTENTPHQHGPGCFFCTTALPLMEKLWSDSTKDHFRNSRIEFLKGVRSLIDEHLEHLTRDDAPKGTHVPVE
ncbi:MAG TPA: hypothetical protein VG456_20705 [Candidatus Sulfopaludibacter sp.]|jgi:hypothetical protein|nr:hypothetical protein [Candidatus Sulfopaludibacter sp.]